MCDVTIKIKRGGERVERGKKKKKKNDSFVATFIYYTVLYYYLHLILVCGLINHKPFHLIKGNLFLFKQL